jgi:hypothetical protein
MAGPGRALVQRQRAWRLHLVGRTGTSSLAVSHTGTWKNVQAVGSQGCFAPLVLLNGASGAFLYFP